MENAIDVTDTWMRTLASKHTEQPLLMAVLFVMASVNAGCGSGAVVGITLNAHNIDVDHEVEKVRLRKLCKRLNQAKEKHPLFCLSIEKIASQTKSDVFCSKWDLSKGSRHAQTTCSQSPRLANICEHQ